VSWSNAVLVVRVWTPLRGLGGQYTITDPFTGEESVEPGWKLMALIKAATERVWDAETALPPVGDSDQDAPA